MGDYDSAMQLYTSVMGGRSPVWARLGMGKTLYEMQKYDKAIKELELLLSSNKYCVQAYDLLAQCYKNIGNTEEAQSVLEAGVKLSPFSINRQRMLGDISVANKDFDTAVAAYRSATRIGQHSIFDNCLVFLVDNGLPLKLEIPVEEHCRLYWAYIPAVDSKNP